MSSTKFVARHGINSLGDLIVTGSITATGGISISGSVTSASFATSASQAQNAVSSSFALTASYAANVPQTASFAISASQAQNATSASFALTSSFANDFTVAGTLTSQTLVVQTITSSIIYSSGSNIFGNDLTNTQVLTGSVTVTGSLAVNNSNVILTNQTSSMSVATASFASTASYVSSNFQYEIHVSQVDGNDTTGNGDLLNPVASITKALTLTTSSRKTIIVHPGTYSENITIGATNTTIATSELTGANTLLSGTLTIGTSGSGSRISGLKMTNLVISGTAQAYISNCTVDNQVTKSSSGYVEIINSEMQCTLGIQISGAGTTIINGNKNVGIAVSNASAQVIIKGCNSVVTPSASAGNLAIVDSIVTALGGNGITITGASTTLTLANSQVLVQAGNNVAPISVAGIYSIYNTVYDKPGSTFTGTSTNSVDYFQYINADNITTQGLIVTGSINVSGSVINNLTSSFAVSASNSISASYALTSSYSLSGTGFPFSGSAVITGSLQITNLTGSGVRYVVTDSDGNVTAQQASASILSTQTVTASAGQTSFNITNGYTTGLINVFVNGTKLNESEYVDTNGTSITFLTASMLNDIVEFQKYLPALGVTNNALRALTTFTAASSQSVFNIDYTPGLLDIYYNGSRLTSVDYTANNGTSITLATASNAGDILDVMVYSYQVGSFSGIGGGGSINQIPYYTTQNSITGSPNFIISGSTMLITGSLLVSGSGTFTNIGPAVFSGSILTTSSITAPVVNSPLLQNGSQYIAQNTSTGITSIVNGVYNWGFYPGGTLQAAGAIVGSTFDATSVDVTQNVLLLKSLYYGAQIITAPDGVTTKTWSFKTGGDLETPAGSYITGSLFGTASNAANSNLLDGKDSTEFAITGSNIFTGVQYNTNTINPNGFGASASIYTDGGVRITKDAYVSGTMFVNNLTVFGTQSINYITSSQLNISTNIISVNTDTPSIRFGGLSVYDSGSTGLTGSMLWDSERDHWVYSNPSGSSYSGGMIMSGPRSSALGSEQGTLNNFVMKGQGGDHITSSQIIDDGTTVRIPGNLQVTGSTILSSALTGTSATFSGNVTINAEELIVNKAGGAFVTLQTSNTTDTQYIQFKDSGGATGAIFYNHTNDSLTLKSGGNNSLILSSTGAATFSSSVTATSISTVFKEGFIVQATTTGGGGSQPGYTYYTAAGSKRWSSFLNVGDDKFHIANASNAELFTIQQNGNFGIGTTSPNALLHINGAGLGAMLRIQNTSTVTGDQGPSIQFQSANQVGGQNFESGYIQSIWTNEGNGFGMRFATKAVDGGQVERMRITSVGNTQFSLPNSGNSVSLGNITLISTATAVNDRLTISFAQTGILARARAGIGSVAEESGGYAASLAFYTRTGIDGSALGTADERMRITSGGSLLVGTTTDSGVVTGNTTNVGISLGGGVIASQVNNNSNQYWSKATGFTSGDFTAHFVNGNYVGGISTNGSTTNYATASDYRLKQDLKEFIGIDLIEKIKTYDYQWKIGETRSYGVIAHELAEVLPYAVNGKKDGEQMQGVDYSKIVPILVKAIQELKAEFDEYKATHP